MSNVIDLSFERRQRSRSRRWRKDLREIDETGTVVLMTASGKIAAYAGPPDEETGDVVFVDAEEAIYGPLSLMIELAHELKQKPSALLMAMGGLHLEPVRAV
ncbi:MAG TPA: hypothetical protein ENJ99_02025 [Rhizobiales bacterium]|nr:hypothetical protein [Hyphomicrobiales bacterium]